MATVQIVDSPSTAGTESGMYSVYTPIKYTMRVSGSPPSTGQADSVVDYVSMKVTITPFNSIINQFENGGTNKPPSKQFSYRVPFTPFIHTHSAADARNDGTYRYFTTDVSSLLKNFLSFNLRPCSHYTQNKNVRRDITLSQISYNVYKRFEIALTPEFLAADGTLTSDSDNTQYEKVNAINSALSYEEEINSYIGDAILNHTDHPNASSYPSEQQHNAINTFYMHKDDTHHLARRQKYLTLKPTCKRMIGYDESEYLSFPVEITSGGDEIVAYIRFYGLDGSLLTHGTASTYYRLDITKSVSTGGGTHNHNQILSHGSATPTGEDMAVVQIGVGTRNIKEAGIDHTGEWYENQPLTDFSGVGYYVVNTQLATAQSYVGEDVYYYIDHSKKQYDQRCTRFHWQNRLGGIDSYTFDNVSAKMLNTSSNTYEQTIYPFFDGQLGISASNNLMNNGQYIGLVASNEDLGAVVPRIAGLTSDEYPSSRKHKVHAFNSGNAVSKIIDPLEVEMFKDLMSSPNVWIEKGWKAKEVFKEEFTYSTGEEFEANWNLADGSSGLVSFSTAEGHVAGTKAMLVGNNSGDDEVHASSKTIFKYRKDRMYEVEVRVKSRGGTSNGLFYCGLTMYDESATDFNGTKISTAGADTFGSAHYVAVEAENLTEGTGNAAKYTTFRGYISGFTKDGGAYGGASPDPAKAARAYYTVGTNVGFFAPMFIANYNDASGRTIIDYIKVTEYSPEEESQKGFMSPLNKNYYVPVLIKDGTTELTNSDEGTKISIDYVESRKNRTIST